MEIRRAELSDAAAIAAILNPIIETGLYTALDTAVSAADERAFLESFPQTGIFLVAAEGPKVLAFQNVEPFADYTRAYAHVGIIATYVDLNHRRRGIGSRLFDATLRTATGKGYRKLFTYIRADNPGAMRAYASFGFQVIGVARNHVRVGDRFVDAVIVERALA